MKKKTVKATKHFYWFIALLLFVTSFMYVVNDVAGFEHEITLSVFVWLFVTASAGFVMLFGNSFEGIWFEVV